VSASTPFSRNASRARRQAVMIAACDVQRRWNRRPRVLTQARAAKAAESRCHANAETIGPESIDCTSQTSEARGLRCAADSVWQGL